MTPALNTLPKPRPLAPLLIAAVVLLLLAAHTPSQAAVRWSAKQLYVGVGTVVNGAGADSAGATTVRADDSGHIFVSIDARGMRLDEFSRVAIEFGEVPAGARFFIAWRTRAGLEGMHHFQAASASGKEISVSLADQQSWRGEAAEIGLGIQTPPGSVAGVKAIALLQPTSLSAPMDRLREWSAFKGWHPSDINRYTGTLAYDQKYAPVPIFGMVLLALLLVYLLYLLLLRGLLRRIALFNWSVAGALLLACWIALDLLWQARLGAQLDDTRATFAGKSSADKLLASGDAFMVQFINQVKTALEGEAPRVFIASRNDFAAMLGAYYIAPVNTYWNRSGQKLPAGEYLASGDYILLIPPFSTPYQPSSGVITLPDETRVPVKQILQNPSGFLVRVI